MNRLDEALLGPKPVFAYFSATWCAPCRAQRPRLESFEDARDDISFVYIDVDNQQDLVSKYGVTAVPTIITFKNGQEVERVTGTKTPYELNNLADNITKLSV